MTSHCSLHSHSQLKNIESNLHVSHPALPHVALLSTLPLPTVKQRILPPCKSGSPPCRPTALYTDSVTSNAKIWPLCKFDCSIQSPSLRCSPNTPVTEIMSQRSSYISSGIFTPSCPVIVKMWNAFIWILWHILSNAWRIWHTQLFRRSL
jgi:hypothetical protein